MYELGVVVAKLHLRLKTFLPGFTIIEEASHHDSSRMAALCGSLQEGEIAVFDKAYVHFKHLYSLTQQTSNTLAILVGSTAVCITAFSGMAVRLAP